jgi:hypothetical protein
MPSSAAVTERRSRTEAPDPLAHCGDVSERTITACIVRDNKRVPAQPGHVGQGAVVNHAAEHPKLPAEIVRVPDVILKSRERIEQFFARDIDSGVTRLRAYP